MSDKHPRVSGFKLNNAETCEYIGPEGVYWSKGPRILFSETLDAPPSLIAKIPLRSHMRFPASIRKGRRLARLTVYNLLPLNDGSLFFSFCDEIGFIRHSKATTINGRIRKSKILRNGIAKLPDGSLVFGEYHSNPERHAVPIYHWNPGSTEVSVMHLFEPGDVRHIHSISWDPYTERAIVATGDIGKECRLLAYDNKFNHVDVLGEGSETWRTISPQFSPDAIYFGTDAEFEQNRIYRYDRRTREVKPLADVNGPVFYSARLGRGWIFCTTAEMCPSQLSPEAVIYYLDGQEETVTTLARFKKDHWPKKYFQLGVLNLPILHGPTDRIPISGTALSRLDGKFIMVET